MTVAPADRVLSNAGVLSGHLSATVDSLENSLVSIPFFSTEELSAEELVMKLGREVHTYGTFAQMACASQLNQVVAIQREAHLANLTRAGLYSEALLEATLERDWILEDGFLLSRTVDHRTVSQRGTV